MAQQLPKDSLVLVTGANGYIGSHVCEQFLQAGYRVRGTVRNPEASSWLESYFSEKHGPGRFELFKVVDILKPNALDDAVKGVAAVAHVASDMSFGTDPNVCVAPIVENVKSALESAAKEPGVKSFVLTSSSTAAALPSVDKAVHVDPTSWNEQAVKDAWAETFDNQGARIWACYAASKVQGEQAAWEYIKEKKPHFTFNTVLPDTNFGAVYNPEKQGGSTAGFVKSMYTPEGFQQTVGFVSPQWCVHVDDTARLHVAAATDLGLNGERLFAYAEKFNWNDVLKVCHQVKPDKDLPAKWDKDDYDQTTVANERALEVLQKRFGQQNWLSLEQAVRETILGAA